MSPMRLSRTLLAVAALAACSFGQTFTSCNPLNSTCPSDPALGTTYSQDFSKQTSFDSSIWNVTAGGSLITFGNSGVQMALKQRGDSVTVQSNFYMFFGQAEFIFQAANGQGLISTAILISDDLDEIDWEIKGSNYTGVSNNWYGHGNLDQYNSQYPNLANAQSGFHNYTIDWNQDRLLYILDGNVVRTVNSAPSGEYPQTPMQVRFGIWSAGDSDQSGTVAWAGGATDWSKAPFNMVMKSVRFVDAQSNVTQYSYSDHSGSWSSIKSSPGVSQAYNNIHRQSTSQQVISGWNNLSTGAKIGIIAGVGSALALAILGFCIWCFMERKKGREERRIADKEWDLQQNEMIAYRRMMASKEFSQSHLDYRDSNRF